MNTGQFRGFEVTVEEPGIAWIRFNEPEKLNGMHAGKKRDLIETLTQAQMDNAIRVIVFTGEGPGFCAGDDPLPKPHRPQTVAIGRLFSRRTGNARRGAGLVDRTSPGVFG